MKEQSEAAVRALLRQLNVKPQRLRGQNFLIDTATIRRIAAVHPFGPDDNVLEIGPGLGALSYALAEQAGSLTLLELEPAFAAHLQRAFAGAAHVRVVQADALRFAYDSLYADGYALFANMPYHITTPLLKRLLCDGGAWRSMVLMMQKEAAHRICLGQGRDNGPLSLLAAYYGVCELCFDLPPAAFYPPPAVTSTVIRITCHATPPVPGDIAAIMRIVEAGFAERRKLLANSLAASPLPGGKDDWLAALAACGLPADCRAESLSLTDFAALARWQTAYFA